MNFEQKQNFKIKSSETKKFADEIFYKALHPRKKEENIFCGKAFVDEIFYKALHPRKLEEKVFSGKSFVDQIFKKALHPRKKDENLFSGKAFTNQIFNKVFNTIKNKGESIKNFTDSIIKKAINREGVIKKIEIKKFSQDIISFAVGKVHNKQSDIKLFSTQILKSTLLKIEKDNKMSSIKEFASEIINFAVFKQKSENRQTELRKFSTEIIGSAIKKTKNSLIEVKEFTKGIFNTVINTVKSNEKFSSKKFIDEIFNKALNIEKKPIDSKLFTNQIFFNVLKKDIEVEYKNKHEIKSLISSCFTKALNINAQKIIDQENSAKILREFFIKLFPVSSQEIINFKKKNESLNQSKAVIIQNNEEYSQIKVTSNIDKKSKNLTTINKQTLTKKKSDGGTVVTVTKSEVITETKKHVAKKMIAVKKKKETETKEETQRKTSQIKISENEKNDTKKNKSSKKVPNLEENKEVKKDIKFPVSTKNDTKRSYNFDEEVSQSVRNNNAKKPLLDSKEIDSTIKNGNNDSEVTNLKITKNDTEKINTSTNTAKNVKKLLVAKPKIKMNSDLNYNKIVNQNEEDIKECDINEEEIKELEINSNRISENEVKESMRNNRNSVELTQNKTDVLYSNKKNRNETSSMDKSISQRSEGNTKKSKKAAYKHALKTYIKSKLEAKENEKKNQDQLNSETKENDITENNLIENGDTKYDLVVSNSKIKIVEELINYDTISDKNELDIESVEIEKANKLDKNEQLNYKENKKSNIKDQKKPIRDLNQKISNSSNFNTINSDLKTNERIIKNHKMSFNLDSQRNPNEKNSNKNQINKSLNNTVKKQINKKTSIDVTPKNEIKEINHSSQTKNSFNKDANFIEHDDQNLALEENEVKVNTRNQPNFNDLSIKNKSVSSNLNQKIITNNTDDRNYNDLIIDNVKYNRKSSVNERKSINENLNSNRETRDSVKRKSSATGVAFGRCFSIDEKEKRDLIRPKKKSSNSIEKDEKINSISKNGMEPKGENSTILENDQQISNNVQICTIENLQTISTVNTINTLEDDFPKQNLNGLIENNLPDIIEKANVDNNNILLNESKSTKIFIVPQYENISLNSTEKLDVNLTNLQTSRENKIYNLKEIKNQPAHTNQVDINNKKDLKIKLNDKNHSTINVDNQVKSKDNKSNISKTTVNDKKIQSTKHQIPQMQNKNFVEEKKIIKSPNTTTNKTTIAVDLNENDDKKQEISKSKQNLNGNLEVKKDFKDNKVKFNEKDKKKENLFKNENRKSSVHVKPTVINKNLLNSASNKILNNKNVKKSVISIPANKDHKEIKEVKEIKVIKVSEKQRKSSVATVRATNINIENKQNKNENKKQSITTNHKDIDTISVNSALTVQTKATKSVNPDSRLSNKTEKTAVGNDNNLQSSRSNAKLSNIKEENQTNKKKIVFPNSKFEVNAEVYYPRASIKEKNKISLKNNPYTCNGEKKIDTFLDYEEMKKKLGRKNLILKFNNSKVKDPYLIKKVYEAYPLFFKVFEKIAQPLKYYTTEWRRFIREEV